MSFHSLQTGKPIARGQFQAHTGSQFSVSIPFKRESLSQVWKSISDRVTADASFHSLQTGKPIASIINITQRRKPISCFNSLQTGKPIASIILGSVFLGACSKFPFPSNGKAYRKVRKMRQKPIRIISFHSLQTGKPIASSLDLNTCPKV